jgi:hypothetical protein
MERLVAGRERIYLDRFWNDFAADPSKFDEGSRTHYAELYARPGHMHAGFAQFAAFDQDVVDKRAAVGRGRLKCPCWQSEAIIPWVRPWPTSGDLRPTMFVRSS